MNLKIAAVASVWLIAGPPNFPSEEEQNRLGKPYEACLAAAAERLDDGKSDIAVLGLAVVAVCHDQFEQLLSALGQNLSIDDQQKLREGLSSMEIGFAGAAVGKLRARRRNILPK